MLNAEIKSLDDLRRINLDFIESARRSGNLEGIKKLLTDLYPDNAHFIYELLQNAEDTHASTVRFHLDAEAVIFEHDGKAFTLADVCSITKIGESTKPDDATKIGKFGVGFKAVFAYTKTPEVHSDPYHFSLVDMLIPEPDLKNSDSGELGTRFVLPFNHPNKTPQQATAEIHRALCNLGANTLLFLSHIRHIEYSLIDGSKGSIRRVDNDEHHIEIIQTLTEGHQEHSHWLRFQKEITITDGEKQLRRQYAIAYSLKKAESKGNETASWRIEPLENGQVSIYFPAVKEPCELKFHIHAPFASTVARDSVRDCEENNQLRDRIAELVIMTLPQVRDRGLLNMSFLATLPNRLDTLSPLLEPIRAAIFNAFRTDPLTPTRSGHFAPATTLFRGPARISEVIEDDDLAYLTGHEAPLWVANPPQMSQRDDRFLESLFIKNWDWSNLAETFSPSDDECEHIESWLEEGRDDWLMRLYALLGDAINNHHEWVYASSLKLVRVSTANGHSHVNAKEAFFTPEGQFSAPKDVHFVKEEVYNRGRSESQKKLARYFLQKVGVRDFDERAIIELKLEEYERAPINATSDYYDSIKHFVSYWKNNPSSATNLFTDHSFLLSDTENGGYARMKPSELCLDRPYLDTGLESFTEIHGKVGLSISYHRTMNKMQGDDFVDFLKGLGVMRELTVTRGRLSNNAKFGELYKGFDGTRETDTSTRDDYTINNLSEYIGLASEKASLLVWNAVIKAKSSASKARYSPNQKYQPNVVDSQLVQILQSHEWVPDKYGSFKKPQQMSQVDLPEEFVCDMSNGLLKAIGFGTEAEMRSSQYQAENDAAIGLGFESADEGKQIAKLLRDRGLSPKDLEDILPAQKKVVRPEESVLNPERRRKGVLARGETAPDRESVSRERRIQPGLFQEMADARAYLRTKYTNSDGQLICQACQDEMPFKIREEHYYFEAIQCVSKLDKHFFENRLALCPTCAAMYVHARETTDDELRSALTNPDLSETSGSISITVKLAGQSVSLYFVGPHWFDLKTVLNGS